MGTISASLLDRYRDINVEHDDWWCGVYREHVKKMAELGIDTDYEQIQFTGFWSQGDGASFTGRVDMRLFLEKHPDLLKDRPALQWFIERGEYPDGSLVRISHHYSHARTVAFRLDDDFQDDSERDSLREAVFSVQYDAWCVESVTLERAIDRIIEGYADDLYSQLEKVHEYLTSDEAVRETLEANEIYDEEDEDECAEESHA